VSAAAAPTRRINRGRGHSYEIDGQRVESVTWAKDNGLPSRGLINWAAETTAGYAVDHWEELGELTPSKRLSILNKARFETRDAAKVRGTQVHTFAMRLAAGEEVEVPEPLQGHVDAYLQFVEDWKPRELLVEQPVYNRTLSYAGTPDLIAELIDGAVWLLDWKTNAGGIYSDAAVQLAAYRFAEFSIGPDGDEIPLPAVDRVGAVWLRADGYDLHPVNADERTFRLWRYAREVARFAEAGRDGYVAESLTVAEALAA
jgi:hypothetical protein